MAATFKAPRKMNHNGEGGSGASPKNKSKKGTGRADSRERVITEVKQGDDDEGVKRSKQVVAQAKKARATMPLSASEMEDEVKDDFGAETILNSFTCILNEYMY